MCVCASASTTAKYGGEIRAKGSKWPPVRTAVIHHRTLHTVHPHLTSTSPLGSGGDPAAERCRKERGGTRSLLVIFEPTITPPHIHPCHLHCAKALYYYYYYYRRVCIPMVHLCVYNTIYIYIWVCVCADRMLVLAISAL